MVGRAVCAKPWYWATVDSQLYGAASDPQPHRRALLHDYSRWAEAEEARHPQRIRRLLLSPALNLFSGEPYGKKFRAAMDTRAKDETLSFSQLVLGAAEDCLLPETLDAPPGATWDQNSKVYVLPEDQSAAGQTDMDAHQTQRADAVA